MLKLIFVYTGGWSSVKDNAPLIAILTVIVYKLLLVIYMTFPCDQ